MLQNLVRCPIILHFWQVQSSQVDLLAKSEISDGVNVVCDAARVTSLEGFGGMLPEEILKNGSS